MKCGTSECKCTSSGSGFLLRLLDNKGRPRMRCSGCQYTPTSPGIGKLHTTHTSIMMQPLLRCQHLHCWTTIRTHMLLCQAHCHCCLRYGYFTSKFNDVKRVVGTAAAAHLMLYCSADGNSRKDTGWSLKCTIEASSSIRYTPSDRGTHTSPIAGSRRCFVISCCMRCTSCGRWSHQNPSSCLAS